VSKRVRGTTNQKPRTVKRRVEFEPKTEGQEIYLEAIEDNDVVFCSGLAGSGKSLLAVGMALRLMYDYPDKYKKIVMVRPYVAVQGEDMGYLPGDIDEKMAPFLAPLVDSLDFFLNKGEIASLKDSGSIEVIPIGFMRGRTLSNCVIIFDEAQNSTWEQMKMFLTRIGFNAKAIIEGDITQSDLPDAMRHENGLLVGAAKLEGVDGIDVVYLESEDVVRSPIVKRMLDRLV